VRRFIQVLTFLFFGILELKFATIERKIRKRTEAEEKEDCSKISMKWCIHTLTQLLKARI
jgi:hypothetical protein